MKNAKEYIYEKIDEIKAQYNPETRIPQITNSDIQRKWRLFETNRNNIWRQVECIDDVHKSINSFCKTVELTDLHVPFGNISVFDEYYIAISLQIALLAMKKIAISLDTITVLKSPGFRNVTQNEIDEMFGQINFFTEKMNGILSRKLMQG